MPFSSAGPRRKVRRAARKCPGRAGRSAWFRGAVRIRPLLRKDQTPGIKAPRLQCRQPVSDEGLTGLRLAGQYPQIAALGPGDDGPAVIIRQVDDPVIPEEGPEKADLELGIAACVGDPGAALGDTGGPVQPVFQHEFEDPDHVVGPSLVLGDHAVAAAFETVIGTRDLEPSAQISIEIDGRHNGGRGVTGQTVARRRRAGRQGEQGGEGHEAGQ